MTAAESISESGTRPQWQTATVVDKQRVAPETVRLRFRIEDALAFIPGQYVNLRVSVAGRTRPVQRAFSIGSVPPADVIEIAVSRLDGGLTSPILVDDIEVGDELQLRGPHGRFTYSKANRSPLYMVAAGTGIVPFLSMLRHIDRNALDVPATLLVSSRTRSHAISAAELDELAQRSEWFRVFHTFTRDAGATFQRRIDAAMLEKTGAGEAKSIYVCGPPAMVDTTIDALRQLGVDPSMIRIERY